MLYWFELVDQLSDQIWNLENKFIVCLSCREKVNEQNKNDVSLITH